MDGCKGCIYMSRLYTQGPEYCNFLQMTGQIRPGEVAGCEVKKTMEDNDMGKREWDKEKAMELYQKGKGDRAIGDALGVSDMTVRNWRKKMGLSPVTKRDKKPAAPKPVAEAPKPVEEPVAEAKPEAVDHPSHYQSGEYECIKVMEAVYGVQAVKFFSTLNVFKYMWRAEQKNGLEDLKKASWYLAKRIELEEKE